MTSVPGADPQPPPRRDNGLRANQFVALADVDPRLGEHLLDLLRLAEIAAYLEPSTDPRVSVRYRASGPVERLYVHADQRQQARAVVVAAAHEAGESADGSITDAASHPWTPPPAGDVLDGIDTDAEFARIIAGFSGTNGAGPNPRPDVAQASPGAGVGDEPINRRGIDPADLVLDPERPDDHRPDDHRPEDDRPEDHGPEDHGPEDHGPDDALVTPAELDAAAGAAAHARAAADRHAAAIADDGDADDHFHRPPAPPFPVPTANTVGAVLLLVLGILVLLRGDLFGLDSNTSFPASVILLLAGSALIIRGLRDRPEPGEEPEDDGAEV